MKRLSATLAILCLGLGTILPCLGDADAQAAQVPGLSQQVAGFVVQPWVTAALLFLGMMLLISELAIARAWGVAGTVGVLCLGGVFASHAVAGIAAWASAALLLGGVALLLIEAGVLPGHGISAVGGAACLFVGLYKMVGGAAAGLPFAISVAAMCTVLSVIALLVYLPRSSVWREMGRKLQVTVARPYVTTVDAERVEIATTGPAEVTQDASAAEKKLKLDRARTDSQTEEDEQQQILGSGPEE